MCRTLIASLLCLPLLAVLATGAAAQTATITLVNPDPAPDTEGSGKVHSYTVLISQAQSTAVPVRICHANADGATACFDLTIPANATSSVHTFGPQDGNDRDGPDFVLTTTVVEDPDNPLPAGISIDSDAASTVLVIRDDDPTLVRLDRAGSGAVIPGGAVAFTVTLGRALMAGETIDVPLAVSGAGVKARGYTLSVKRGRGAALSRTGTLTPQLRFSGAGAREATLELRLAADSAAPRYRIALGPDGSGANGFDRSGLGTNVGGGADPSGTRNSFDVPVNTAVFIAGGPAVTEGVPATFRLTARPAPSADIAVKVDVTDSGSFARAGQTGSRMVTVGTGGTATFRVWTVNDRADERSGAIGAAVRAGDGYAVGSPSSASVTIRDDDGPVPAVSFTSASHRVGEASGTHHVTLKLDPAPTDDIVVNYTVAGTATAGSDYTALSGTVSVTAGASTATIPVAIVDDGAQDGTRDETVRLSLVAGAGYTVVGVGDAKFYRLLIVDGQPAPAVSFATASQSAGEGSGTRDVKLYLKPAPDADITVTYHVSGTASSGADYTALSGKIAVPAGATTATVPVAIADDTAVEGSETIVLTLGGSDAYLLKDGGTARHVLTIADDDALPEAWFATASQSADEGSGTRDIVVNLSRAARSPVTVSYTVSGTATAGTDYAALSGMVTVPAGKAAAAIRVTIVDDGVPDRGETVVVALAGGAGYRVAGLDRHTLAIADNEPVPGVAFGSGQARLSERAGRYDVAVRLWPAPTMRTTVSYELCGGGFPANATPGSDFAPPSGSLTVEPGTTMAAIPLTIHDDDANEDEESLALCLIEGKNYALAASGAGYTQGYLDTELVIVDDDGSSGPAVPNAAFASNVSYGGEASGTRNVLVRLLPAPTSAITLNYTRTGGTARSGSDFAALSGSVSVPAGAATAVIPVEIKDDSVPEDPESVVLTLAAGTGYTPKGDWPSHALYIMDDDGSPPSTPVASFASASSTAGEASGTRNVTVNLEPAPASPIALTYTVGGTATAGSGNDFTIANTGTVQVAANAKTATIAVAVVDDDTPEDSETVELTLSAGAGYSVGGSGTHVLTVVDNDDAPASMPVVSFASASSSAGEEGGAQEVILNFDPPPASPITIGVTTLTATATILADYSVVGGALLNPRNPYIILDIPAGARSASLRVKIVDDSEQEGDETVVLQLQDATGHPYRVGSPDLHTLTIVDNDGASPPSMPVASFAAASANADEGSGTRKVAVNLSPAPASDITLAYTVGGTATSVADYAALSGTVSVKAGATEAAISVAIADERAAEPPETVVLTLSAGTGYTLGGARVHTLTIADNDPSLTLWFASGASTAREVSGTHDVTLNVRPAPATDVTVAYTVGGTATPDTDYTALSGTLTIASGASSATIPVAIVDDSVEDSGETVILRLNGAGYTLGSPKKHVLTIVNRDPDAPVAEGLTVSLSAERSSIAEANGKTKFRIALSRALGAGETVKVPYTVTGGERNRDWSVRFRDRDNGPGVERAGSTRNPAVRFTEGGRAAVLMLVARPNDDTEARTISIAFGTGKRAPSATGVAGGIAPAGDPVAVAIVDDDGVTPEIAVAAGGAATEGGEARFTLSADPAPPADLAVTLRIGGTGGVAAPSALGERTVTLAGGAASRTFSVATVADGTDGPGGAVTATVVADDGYTVGDASDATVTVADDDATGVVLSAPPGDVAEANGRKVLTVALGRALARGEALTAPLVFSGAASLGSDYTLSAPATRPQGVTYANLASTDPANPPTLTFTGPSASSATLILAATADAASEGTGETVTVELGTLGATGLYGGAEGSGALGFAILEPPPEIAIAAKTASIAEGADASFTVTASRAVGADLAVSLSVSEAAGSDFVAAGNEGAAAVTIPKGETEATFTVPTVNDAADEPDGTVTVALAAGGDSARYTVAASPKDAASVEVTDDDAAATGPALSVADATAQESERLMRFRVRLSPASDKPVWVHFRTRESRPVSAREGMDYLELGTSVRFAPGETEKEALVYIFDDSHDEDPETFELVLSHRSGAAIADGVAVGTIVNSDPMPAAWLSRFGRTVAEQALDGIAGRMAAPRTPGAQGAIAGQALSFGSGGPDASGGAANDDMPAGNAPLGGPSGSLSPAQSDVVRAFGASTDHLGTSGFGHDAHGLGESRTMTGRDLLLGSSFTATGETDGAGGSLAFWGRAARSNFDGREGTFSLDGEVTTGMLGADYARGNWLAGLALMQSSGEGGYADSGAGPQHCPDDGAGMDPGTMAFLCGGAVQEGDGEVEASLTAAVPYAAIQASERLKLWGAAGYGTGEVTLKPTMGGSLGSDISWTMAAAGARNDLLDPPAEGSGPALALTSDALWARTTSEKTHELAASDSDVTRLRLGLEGGYRIATEGGGHVTPKLEVGARHDGGDAETGFGVELGGGIAWNDPALGLALDLSGRTLIAHASDDLEDRGFGASLVFDPDPATQRGLSLTLRQDWGGAAQGGLDALFAPDPLEDRTGSGDATARWAMEAAYGFPAFGGRFTGSPHVGLRLATAARDYTLGWRLAPAANADAPDVSFGLNATRRESDTAEPEHRIGFEAVARW